MSKMSALHRFLADSNYSAPVDIKKLKFIYSALEAAAVSRGKGIGDLRILEVACGDGGITFPVASLGCAIRTFDIDRNAVESVRDRIAREAVDNIEVSVDDGKSFDDGKIYDVVIASEVFEHVTDPSRLAANIIRRMLKGSYLVVTTPNGYGPWEMKNRLSRDYLSRWNALRRFLGKPPFVKKDGPYHCQFYTRKALLRLMTSFSLELRDFGKSDSLIVALPYARKSRFLGRMDVKLADILPHWCASGWYFVFELI